MYQVEWVNERNQSDDNVFKEIERDQIKSLEPDFLRTKFVADDRQTLYTLGWPEDRAKFACRMRTNPQGTTSRPLRQADKDVPQGTHTSA